MRISAVIIVTLAAAGCRPASLPSTESTLAVAASAESTWKTGLGRALQSLDARWNRRKVTILRMWTSRALEVTYRWTGEYVLTWWFGLCELPEWTCRKKSTKICHEHSAHTPRSGAPQTGFQHRSPTRCESDGLFQEKGLGRYRPRARRVITYRATLWRGSCPEAAFTSEWSRNPRAVAVLTSYTTSAAAQSRKMYFSPGKSSGTTGAFR